MRTAKTYSNHDSRLLVVDDHIPTREQAVTDLTTGGLIQVVGQARNV